ncbi:MAG: endo-1,4-beta-xylanase [Bacteroidota bacterium]
MLAISGASFAAGYGVSQYWRTNQIDNIINGEEWRNDRKINEKDLRNLDSDETVLSEAKKLIQQHRRGDFKLQLQMSDGSPFSNQVLQLKQISHEVDWGCSAAGSALLLIKDENHQEMSRNFAELFNCTTAKCYWEERWHQPIERYRERRVYDKFLDEVKWSESLGIKVKGHPLVWTVPKAIPKWVHDYPYEQQLQFLKRHVQSMIEAAGPSVQLWDLCNEMLWEPAFKNIAKREWPHIDPIEDIAEYIAFALEWAREINPEATYSLNDYGLVHTYRQEISAGDQRQRYLKLVEALRVKGQVPDAIGCQTHVGGNFRLAAFKRTLQELAQSNLPLQVTEFWAKEKGFPQGLSPDELEQQIADYICQMYTVGFAEPLLSHFTYWGNRVFFDKQGQPKLAYKKLHQLIKNDWSTKTELQTNENGQLTFSGFKGSYTILQSGQKEALAVVDLYQSNSDFEKVIVN